MCVAIMGKVTKLDEKNAVVEYGGAKIKARRDFVNIDIGDKVMVHAGYVMQRISEEDAKIMEEILDIDKNVKMLT